jgi:subtilisin family serine protease
LEEIMLKKPLFSLVLAAILLLTSAAPALAGDGGPIAPLNPLPSVETGELVDETPHMWFVQLSSPPSVDGTSAATLKSERDSFRSNASRKGLHYQVRMQYDTLWNGLSISMPSTELSKLYEIDGITGIYPVQTIPMPQTTSVNDPELFTALAMTGADVAQSELGYTGKGIKVAVMDTGIDYDHSDLGGDGVARSNSHSFPTGRVIKGWDFVGDDFNADDTSASYNPVTAPDAYPDDCNGHGTHVSGIIGANGEVKGVAPDVKFGAYRVFGCDGSTSDDIMLAAMERAYKDGMDVLNMSIGAAFEWPQSPTSQAASRLVRKGMVVVASFGNNGANGLYSGGAPGVGDEVIGVASFDNTHVYLPSFTVNDTSIGYVTMTYSPDPPTSGSGEVVDVGLACSPLAVDLTGKVALAARGTCSFSVKATNAINAGADAVLISNNAAGVFNGTLGAPLANPKPVVGISKEDGIFLRAQAAPVTMTWTDQMISSPSPTGGLISSFSSYGFAPDLTLKPDIGAPGGNIYSTFPLEQGGYANLSGTSMASPHVAGAVALYLQAHPRARATEIRDALQNNAEPADWWGYPGIGYLDNVTRQGAGMLRIDRAIEAKTSVTPAKLSLGESEAGTVTRKLTVTNNSKSAVTYTLSYVNALSVVGTFAPDFWDSDAVVTFSSDTITVKPRRSATFKATIMPATYPDQGQYGGYIVLTGSDGSVLRVPYAGFVGDYQSIQVLTPTTYGLPLLVDQDFNILPDGGTFTLQDGDLPYLVVHFDHQARLFFITILNANTGLPIHRIFNRAFYAEYFGRNSSSTGYFAIPWDGTRIHNYGFRNTGEDDKTVAVPNGDYILEIHVLKALGNPFNPADWETWQSPVITIARP